MREETIKLPVVFTPEAQTQLIDLFNYVQAQSSATTALRFTSEIIDFCLNLGAFPNRGVKRSDIRENLRITHYKKRTIVAFYPDADRVTILGIFYGGQNYSGHLLQEP